jgi:dTDP-4-amino-4,6-dideoxygalactose transaminase
LIDAGIESRPPWQLNHTQLPYQDARHGVIRQAAMIVDEGLHLPSSAALSADDQAYVVETLELALRE